MLVSTLLLWTISAARSVLAFSCLLTVACCGLIAKTWVFLCIPCIRAGSDPHVPSLASGNSYSAQSGIIASRHEGDAQTCRVWLHQGVLHVIPKQYEVAGNVRKALDLVSDHQACTEAAEPIQQVSYCAASHLCCCQLLFPTAKMRPTMSCHKAASRMTSKRLGHTPKNKLLVATAHCS